jgi:hypothetical protein
MCFGKVHQHSGVSYRLHLQGPRASQARKQQGVGSKQSEPRQVLVMLRVTVSQSVLASNPKWGSWPDLCAGLWHLLSLSSWSFPSEERMGLSLPYTVCTVYVTILYRNLQKYMCIWNVHYATSRKVAGSITDEVTKFFSLPNHSSCTTVLGSTQPLTEMSTRNLLGGWVKGCRRVRLTTSSPSVKI